MTKQEYTYETLVILERSFGWELLRECFYRVRDERKARRVAELREYAETIDAEVRAEVERLLPGRSFVTWEDDDDDYDNNDDGCLWLTVHTTADVDSTITAQDQLFARFESALSDRDIRPTVNFVYPEQLEALRNGEDVEL